MKAIINGRIVTPNDVLENKILIVENGKITGIVDELPKNAAVIDAKGYFVAAGLIDIHIHGSLGADVMDGTLDAIQTIAQGIAQYGTTSFLPTTMTTDYNEIIQALTAIRRLQNQPPNGAKILGAHLEGPFINAKYKGAQNEKFITVPDLELIREFADVIKIITYAPEMDADFAFTKSVKNETTIKLSIGHSNATYVQAKQAIAHGCSNITHLFNAMTGLHHRDPGIVGAAFMEDVFTEIIADKIHIDQHLFQFILDNKTAEKVVLITDSMRAGGEPDGMYDLGGQDVIVKKGVATLSDGTLAGSVLTLNQAVKNMYDNTTATLSEVIRMASLTPATALGIADHKGSLESGKDADIILLDEHFNCRLTMVEGDIVYENL